MGGAYRKTLPRLSWGVFTLIDDESISFELSLKMTGAVWLKLKAPNPEPPGINCEELSWAK